MKRNHWESSYRQARSQLRTPAPLETKILADIRAVKPIHPTARSSSRLLSRAASGFSAVAIAIVLLHPAQYIGAAPGQWTPQQSAEPAALERYRPKPVAIEKNIDEWHSLRTEVKAGSYTELCAQWRRQQRGAATNTLPNDLASAARKHCRILP